MVEGVEWRVGADQVPLASQLVVAERGCHSRVARKVKQVAVELEQEQAAPRALPAVGSQPRRTSGCASALDPRCAASVTARLWAGRVHRQAARVLSISARSHWTLVLRSVDDGHRKAAPRGHERCVDAPAIKPDADLGVVDALWQLPAEPPGQLNLAPFCEIAHIRFLGLHRLVSP